MPDWNHWIPITAASVLGVFMGASAVAVFSPVSTETWEAVGALSGWAAGLGAFVAALLTLRPLLGQLHEARRQTDYIVGDSYPTLDLFVDQDLLATNVLNVRITNWNRRSIIISDFRIHKPQCSFRIIDAETRNRPKDAKPVGLSRSKKHAGKIDFYGGIRLAGWENRSEMPARFRMKIEVYDQHQRKRLREAITSCATIRLDGKIATLRADIDLSENQSDQATSP
ncbi:hypothetical protein [Amorphus orientalis]|uniref:Uncharacterized protein n=1 Tax=Amorphus orientalis TaxID=649198 RepID=A0AAE4AS41_9HYPH|nr:hypothetical protein [Amorphus orientalis]MDQ0314833.1 hypothetical protein [Amorphus orientalis]